MDALIPNIAIAAPEMALATVAMLLLLLGVLQKDGFELITRLSVLVLLLLFAWLFWQPADRMLTFGGMFISDSFALFNKGVVLLGSTAALLLSTGYLKEQGIARFEYPILILLATLGMMIMVSANTLLTLYVGLELQSLSLYVLAAINRDRIRSTEAGLKYFVLGALSSGMLLYGVSLVYGFAGSLEFDIIAGSVGDGPSLGLLVGLVFVMAGLAFKISAVPFHMWTPDVYEGAPTPVTAFFAAAPKVAAFALLIRLLINGFPSMGDQWQQVIVFMSIASMLVGAFIALVQTNIKRLLAYSSIGHVGYALIGVAAGTQTGIEAVLLYMAIYAVMTLGAFGVVLMVRRGGMLVEDIDDLAGLSKSYLPLAVAMAILMFSLAGIPLLLGFFGKWFIFDAAVRAGLIPLAMFGVVTSVVGAYYYLRIVKLMFFDEPKPGIELAPGRGVRLVVGVSAVVNSPISYVGLIGTLVSAAGWGAHTLLF